VTWYSQCLLAWLWQAAQEKKGVSWEVAESKHWARGNQNRARDIVSKAPATQESSDKKPK